MRGAPHRILSFHAADQVSYFFRQLRPSHSLPTGSPCPEQAVSGAMPRDYRIGLDENGSSDQLAQIRRTTHGTGDRTDSAWGAAVCVCTRQVAVEEQPPPLPDRCRAIRNARTYASAANRAVTITPMLV